MVEKSKPPLILVVDDNPDIRNMIMTHLEGMQCEVLEASNGEDGLAMILSMRPDLVLLDVMMPGLNGWEIARYIREKPEYENMGVIMVTAIGQAVNELTAPLYGADDYIDKPFQWAELDFKIRQTLFRKRKHLRSKDEESSVAYPL
jgi:DNA-binding response OmpR family regulator